MQARAAGRYGSLPQERAAIARLEVQAGFQARSARSALGVAVVGLRQAAARETEASPHLWAARAAVPALLCRGRAPQGIDWREPAADAGVAPRQRGLSDGIRLDAGGSAPAR